MEMTKSPQKLWWSCHRVLRGGPTLLISRRGLRPVSKDRWRFAPSVVVPDPPILMDHTVTSYLNLISTSSQPYLALISTSSQPQHNPMHGYHSRSFYLDPFIIPLRHLQTHIPSHRQEGRPGKRHWGEAPNLHWRREALQPSGSAGWMHPKRAKGGSLCPPEP